MIGWHAHARLHAENCAARFRDEPNPFEILALDHAMFDDDIVLKAAVEGADAILHLLNESTHSEVVVEAANHDCIALG